MTRLSLDPASVKSGYALMTATKLIEFGLLTGGKAKGPIARVLAMRQDLLHILAEHLPEQIIIEMPLTLQFTRHAERKSGMAIWAGAAWALWMVCYDWANCQQGVDVIPISNTVWTSGSTKDGRQQMVAAMFVTYDPAKDKGGDESDAIAMNLWYGERKLIPND